MLLRRSIGLGNCIPPHRSGCKRITVTSSTDAASGGDGPVQSIIMREAISAAMVWVCVFVGAVTFAATETWSRCMTPFLRKRLG